MPQDEFQRVGEDYSDYKLKIGNMDTNKSI